jgi:hypothetical protein
MSYYRLLSLRSSTRRVAVRGLTTALLGGSALSPAAAQVLVGDGSVTCGSPHVVAVGDTLSRLAERAYGDPMLYGVIADANLDALGGNPENISVGMSLTIPCVDASGQVQTSEQAAEAAESMDAVVQAEGTLSPEELDTLFGPVALFPDQVLTPVLVAITFPLDVVKAGRFVEESAALPDQERAAQAVDKPWDDSVRELAAGFPDLVKRMSDNIDWTEQAGEAVVAQTDEALAAIQRLRTKAQENGYLVDNEAQTVEEVNDKIVIAPTDPNVVYVPTYDSQVVYTTPVAGAPVYHYGYGYDDDWDDWDDALVAGGIVLGGAIILDEIFDDDDWDGWDIDDDIDWDGGDITIDRDDVDIDIDRGDIDRGDGDRPRVGDGDRVSIGESDRTQIDRDTAAGAGDRVGAGDRPSAGNRTPISDDAGRAAARQKIEARKSSGAEPASLKPARQAAAPRSEGIGPSLTAQPRTTTRAANVSRPSTDRAPSVRASTSRSNAFDRPSRGRRAAAAGNRGRSSMGGRGGGRGGGGGGGGRGGGGGGGGRR